MRVIIDYDEKTEVLDIACEPAMSPDEIQQLLAGAYEKLTEETESVH